jgi:exosortase
MRVAAEPDRLVTSVALRDWWPLAIGVAAVLGCSYFRFATDVWPLPNNDHEPVVVAIALFTFWLKRREFTAAKAPEYTFTAMLLLCFGVLALLLGARTKIATLESVAHLVILIGALWLFGGSHLVRRLWFSLFFLLLSIPVPSFLLAMATKDLKELVANVAESAIYVLGYPIARDGVVITIGQYQLLVAEACSGMNSIISLSAIGLVYLYLVPPKRVWQYLATVLCIVPIAVAANIVRIMLLILITYHLGDAAGQGFLHEFAGLAMFAFALSAFIAISIIFSRFGYEPKHGSAHG